MMIQFFLAAHLAALSPGAPQAQDPGPDEVSDLYAYSVRIAEEARGKAPSSAKAVFDLGRAHQRFQMDDRAIETFREGLRLEPRHPEILFEIGFLLSQRNRMDEAIASFRDALRIDPAFPEAHTRLGLIHFHEGKMELARKELLAEIENRSPTGLTYTILGHVFRDLKQHPQAIVAYREAIRLTPLERGAHYGLLQVLQTLGRKEEEAKARAHFQGLVTSEDESQEKSEHKKNDRETLLRFAALTCIDAASTYQSQKLMEDCERALRRATRFCPALPGPWKMLLERYSGAGRGEELARLAQEFLEKQGTPEAHYALGGVRIQEGKFAEAARLFEISIEKGSEDGAPYRELARLILQKRVPGAPGRALELSRQAVEKTTAAANFDIFAWALYNEGKRQEAFEALESATRLDPGNEGYRKRLEEMRKKI